MKKEKIVYRFYRYQGKEWRAKREIPYELRLFARLIMDELCFNWNKARLEEEINISLENGHKDQFINLSEEFKHFVWE
ncbi:IDEAL domain-containing protein [Oceanobacillus damuensis]|uniref:IDEAL domain-containing protein n=1 Tax=Oceanobacillus damuensis TaxID=937928 RepID=UPI000836C7D9|nr:IDEAL domain-containing protein [Oceanobacillus damuensis]